MRCCPHTPNRVWVGWKLGLKQKDATKTFPLLKGTRKERERQVAKNSHEGQICASPHPPTNLERGTEKKNQEGKGVTVNEQQECLPCENNFLLAVKGNSRRECTNFLEPFAKENGICTNSKNGERYRNLEEHWKFFSLIIPNVDKGEENRGRKGAQSLWNTGIRCASSFFFEEKSATNVKKRNRNVTHVNKIKKNDSDDENTITWEAKDKTSLTEK